MFSIPSPCAASSTRSIPAVGVQTLSKGLCKGQEAFPGAKPAQGQAHQAALQAGCVAVIPGVGQEADFLVGLGPAALRGRSAGVRDLLGGAVAVQAQEAELHRAGPRVFQLQERNPGSGGCLEGAVLPPGQTLAGSSRCSSAGVPRTRRGHLPLCTAGGPGCCPTAVGWHSGTPDLTCVSPRLLQPGTHQEATGQGAEPLKGVLRGVGAQPSLDGDLRGAGTMARCPGRGQWH